MFRKLGIYGIEADTCRYGVPGSKKNTVSILQKVKKYVNHDRREGIVPVQVLLTGSWTVIL
jgi:hypothetical protein